MILLILAPTIFSAQSVPFRFVNNSIFGDDEIYIAIVGIKDGHVWIDCKTGEVHPMSQDNNSVQGPIIGGNSGPGLDGKYADCFTKLSNIQNSEVTIPQIAGTRILISMKSQL